jgi:hypothetical protein
MVAIDVENTRQPPKTVTHLLIFAKVALSQTRADLVRAKDSIAFKAEDKDSNDAEESGDDCDFAKEEKEVESGKAGFDEALIHRGRMIQQTKGGILAVPRLESANISTAAKVHRSLASRTCRSSQQIMLICKPGVPNFWMNEEESSSSQE